MMHICPSVLWFVPTLGLCFAQQTSSTDFHIELFSFAESFVYAEDVLVGKFKILIKFSQITGG